MKYDLSALKKIIINAAHDELLPRFADVQRNTKIDGSFVTEADLAVQTRITKALRESYPDTALLGEEMTAQQQAELLSESDSLWCLDPLDGTSNFAVGTPYYAISLALIECGVATLGIVYDPNRDECFVAIRGQGAWLNDQPLKVKAVALPLSQSTALIDFKRLPAPLAMALVAQRPYGSQRSYGSVALDWCWMAASRFHVYLHGASSLWDYSAGLLVFSEAGGYSSTLQGDAIYVNELSKRSSVGALDQATFDQWYGWLGEHSD
ncbi:MAG: inositol monophosphatase [Gammaproteobacteria bacterium]|nr:inositol monophosphatase [Gammaproteobacteria bacterium]MBT8135084.1 inositol monophosphatase [Gammaproteobacteria bacterium]NNJ51226.1 inositol monophosphatase [Gammaproteobacteria bacterium]